MVDSVPMHIGTLRTELRITLSELEAQINAVRDLAKTEGCESYMLRDLRGEFMLTPLLTAKANALSALTSLQPTKK